MRLYEGNILTCDKENRIAHYLLEDQGKILYCGDELPAGCVAAERVSTAVCGQSYPFRKLRDVSCRAQCHECAEQ